MSQQNAVHDQQLVSYGGISLSVSKSKLVYSNSVLTTKGEGSPYSITERMVPELIPVLGSQPAGEVSHKLCGRLPLLSAMPAVTPATLKRACGDAFPIERVLVATYL